ncbi:MAG: PaaI family thioesterase [Bdellovibrionales bacterium]|nr:PaaI family thioesterase [Bdellovibrionales bacterium]
MASPKLPHQVQPVFEFAEGTLLTPSFPNWERSFVSGHKSPLYKVEHREHASYPGFMVTRVSFLPICEGPPGHVHGGATAGLLDEVLGVCVWHGKHTCVTQTLTLHYGRTIPLGATVDVYSHIKKVAEKIVEVECTVYGSGDDADKEKTPYVSAQGVFHRLTLDQLQRFNEHRKIV